MIIIIKTNETFYSKLSIGKVFRLQIKTPDGELFFKKAKVLYFDDDFVHLEMLDEKIGVDLKWRKSKIPLALTRE